MLIKHLSNSVLIMAAAAVLAACATTNVSVQQALDAETLEQRTYAWASGSVLDEQPEGVSRAQLNAVRNALIETLDAKGYDRIDDATRADLLVNLVVDLDTTQGRGLTDRDDLGRNDEDDIGSVRVFEGRQQPTNTSTRNQRSRTATMARSAGEDAGLTGQISTIITTSISDRASADQIWQGEIQTAYNIADVDAFSYEIDALMAELFKDFPVSATPD